MSLCGLSAVFYCDVGFVYGVGTLTNHRVILNKDIAAKEDQRLLVMSTWSIYGEVDTYGIQTNPGDPEALLDEYYQQLKKGGPTKIMLTTSTMERDDTILVCLPLKMV